MPDVRSVVSNAGYRHAVPVARAETLLRYRRVRVALERLAGRISADDMQAMNYAADAEHQDVTEIARRFLEHVK